MVVEIFVRLSDSFIWRKSLSQQVFNVPLPHVQGKLDMLETFIQAILLESLNLFFGGTFVS